MSSHETFFFCCIVTIRDLIRDALKNRLLRPCSLQSNAKKVISAALKFLHPRTYCAQCGYSAWIAPPR
ncbi:hypothetical protein HNQ38_000879 [Desulfovibrio intestinalis]|uniref:Uncharacterized protein n=1 Tax=Desulfovibrio intestinalis TaxID=58621 RepID=A0A7W8C320_9BACT|nr:hypothetical protein [Desulfovibrio intestinalis]